MNGLKLVAEFLLIFYLVEILYAREHNLKSEGNKNRQERIRLRQQEEKHSEFVKGKSKFFERYTKIL